MKSIMLYNQINSNVNMYINQYLYQPLISLGDKDTRRDLGEINRLMLYGHYAIISTVVVAIITLIIK